MRILVTGAAGFIGAALTEKLTSRGDTVLGIDNLSPYYDVQLKERRLERLKGPLFQFERADIQSRGKLLEIFKSFQPERVVHLAAQAGVRYSLTHPEAYVDANISGFLNILEACRAFPVKHLVFASSSSVYGANRHLPFSEKDTVDYPVSLYAATKKSNELMAHAYSHLYQIPVTGLRFFTVYGPWGRPDMAMFTFTKKILAGEPIELFNNGKHRRDFTYIDDIVEGVIRVTDRTSHAVQVEGIQSQAHYALYNIGNNNPVWLMDVVEALETSLGKKAARKLLPLQPGDVVETYADVSSLEKDFNYRPRTPISEGVQKFVDWYKDYFGKHA